MERSPSIGARHQGAGSVAQTVPPHDAPRPAPRAPRGHTVDMARVHLFEFADLPGFPEPLRRCMSEFLAFVGALSDAPYRDFVERVAGLMEDAGETEVLELCGGLGGPSGREVKLLRELAPDATWTLSDMHPPPRAPDGVHREPAPIDARAIPPDRGGVRVIQNAFHHFAPDDAVDVLRGATEGGRSVAVLEVNARHPLPLFGMLFAPLNALLFAPFQRPFRLTRLVFTYLIPILPLLILWDGVVSCLRVYDPDELRALATRARPDYRWDAERVKVPGTPMFVTVLTGAPPRDARTASGRSTPETPAETPARR